MILNKHAFIGVVVIAYAATLIATFETHYDSIVVFSVALPGLFGWFYGIRRGVLLSLLIIPFNTVILILVLGKPCDIFLTCNPLGIALGLAFAWAMGSIRESQNQLNKLQETLSKHVDEANAELDELARQLIEIDEQERIQIGQDLHDGVGQYLTGMLLHSEFLNQSLQKENRVEAELAEWMTRRIQKTIQIVRQLSHSLLPIQFMETNPETALEEMVAYFTNISIAEIRLECQGESTDIPNSVAQHLYRIAYETIDYAIYKNKATHIAIQLATRKDGCLIIIEGNNTSPPTHTPPYPVSEVMKYRVEAIDGKLDFIRQVDGGFRLECSSKFKKEAL